MIADDEVRIGDLFLWWRRLGPLELGGLGDVVALHWTGQPAADFVVAFFPDWPVYYHPRDRVR